MRVDRTAGTDRSRRARACVLAVALVALALLAAACSDADIDDLTEPAPVGGDDVADALDGNDDGNDDSPAADPSGSVVVEPAATGSLNDFELGGLTLQYDAAYWTLEPFGDMEDPDSALVWFVSLDSSAVVRVSFDTDRDLNSSSNPCQAGYEGTTDPIRHEVTLLHEERLANDGRLRIHRQDLDPDADDPVIGISYAFMDFEKSDDHQVGDTFCSYERHLDDSAYVWDDGTAVLYGVEAFFTFSTDFVFAPFKEQFDSSDAMRSRAGFAEMLALMQTIEVTGTPA